MHSDAERSSGMTGRAAEKDGDGAGADDDKVKLFCCLFCRVASLRVPVDGNSSAVSS